MATKKTQPLAELAQRALGRIASGKTTLNRERLRLAPDTTPAPWLKACKQAAGGDTHVESLAKRKGGEEDRSKPPNQ